jgi:hypothetical protein
MMSLHVNQPPPQLGSLAPVSQPLERIVTLLLAKEPTARFSSMDEVSQALSAIVSSSASKTLRLSPPSPSPASLVPVMSPSGAPVYDASRTSEVLETLLPEHLHIDIPTIHAFLGKLCDGYTWIGGNTLSLINPRVPGAIGLEFFALLLSGVSGRDGQLGTMTFMHHALPLEHHLESLNRDARKVVIVLSDAFELGRGVREKILDYRNRLDALVVPIYLGEIRKAYRTGNLDTLFMDRLADFQTVPDLYVASGPVNDPTRFFGMRHVLDELIAELEAVRRIVVIHGLPGSGKSSLLRMADYGMATARFVRVPCTAMEPAAVTAKIISALGGSGNSTLDLVIAARKAHDGARGGRLVLVLEGGDSLLGCALDHAVADPSGANELLSTLVDLTQAQVISTATTTVRGFAFGQWVRSGLVKLSGDDVCLVEVPRLERQTAGRLVRELGAQMNVTAPDPVVAECARLSGGNVDVLRRLCSGMLKRHRREETHHVLRPVKLTRPDLQNATSELIATRGTFEVLLSWLSLIEQRVLHGVAVSRPKHAGDLVTRELSKAEISPALEALRLLGLVERVGSREQLTIPLLAPWTKVHLDEASRPASRWFSWLH